MRWLVRFVVVLPLCVGVLSATKATPTTTSPSAAAVFTAFMVLDNRWYGVTTARNWDYDTVGLTMFLDDVTATNCRRANGSFPNLGTINNILFGVGTPMTFFAGAATNDTVTILLPTAPTLPVITIRSLDGDLICQGEVAPPPSPTLFSNGFE